MKTTIELPDALLHQAKVTSAQRGVTLKHLFIEGLEYVIGKQSSSKSIQLTHEESKIYQLDAEGVPFYRRGNPYLTIITSTLLKISKKNWGFKLCTF